MHEVWQRDRYVGVAQTQLARRCLWRELCVYFEAIVCAKSRIEYLWKRPYYAAIQTHAFPTPFEKDYSKHLLFLVLRPCFHHQNFRFLHFYSRALLQPNLSFSSFWWVPVGDLDYLPMLHLFYSIRNPKLDTTGANKSSTKPLPSLTRTRFFVLSGTFGVARSSLKHPRLTTISTYFLQEWKRVP